MLRRRIVKTGTDNGVVLYESPLLAAAGVPHAFSTRVGGVSQGPFESLNLGNPNGQAVQDSRENIVENYRRLHEAIGCATRRRVFAHQVHGATVLDPSKCPATDSIHGGTEIGKGDALFTSDTAVVLSVRTADCVPVLLSDRDGRRVAAVHAGWRGVVAGAATAALKHFDDPRHVIAAIGPAIGFDHFEVGPEVVDSFLALPLWHIQKPAAFIRAGVGGKSFIDLRGILTLHLASVGVPASQIDSTDVCTIADAADFFSHRRSGGLTGRMAALIGARA